MEIFLISRMPYCRTQNFLSANLLATKCLNSEISGRRIKWNLREIVKKILFLRGRLGEQKIKDCQI